VIWLSDRPEGGSILGYVWVPRYRTSTMLIILEERLNTLQAWGEGWCNTPCYGSPDHLLIIFIKFLIMHQVPW
jgi:hypothetical protein